MSTATNPVLSDDEVARYHEDGLLVPSFRLPDEMLQRVRASLERFLQDNRGAPTDQMFTPHLRRGQAQDLKGDEVWMDYVRYPPILDMMAQCIGPDFLLWGTTIFGKPAASGKAIPWHQDGEYWPIRPLANATVWIALDDCTTENGCLRYIPGSHKMRQLAAHEDATGDDMLLEKAVSRESYDEAAAQDLLLEAGQMANFDVFLIHGSNANRSGKRRAAWALRFMPTTSHFDHALAAEIAKTVRPKDMGRRPLFLMRGIDRSGLNDFEIGHAETA